MQIKESSGGHYILWVFVMVGVLLMSVGIAVAISFGIDSQNYEKVQATIVDITTSKDSDGDTNYHVEVDYEYNGIKYTNIPTNFWDISMYEGQIIDIYINRDSPTQMRSGTIMIILPCVLFGMGLIMTLIASFPLHKWLKSKRITKHVRKNGEVVFCKITDVIPDTSYRVNGRIVNNILECEPLNEPQIVVTYTSPPFNQKYPIEIGKTIKVYRDRDNPENYYVDLNSIE